MKQTSFVDYSEMIKLKFRNNQISSSSDQKSPLLRTKDRIADMTYPLLYIFLVYFSLFHSWSSFHIILFYCIDICSLLSFTRTSGLNTIPCFIPILSKQSLIINSVSMIGFIIYPSLFFCPFRLPRGAPVSFLFFILLFQPEESYNSSILFSSYFYSSFLYFLFLAIFLVFLRFSFFCSVPAYIYYYLQSITSKLILKILYK